MSAFKKKAAAFLILLSLGAILLAGIWLCRPMFGNDFGRGEMAILPWWHVTPQVNHGRILLCDFRQNIVLLVDTGDPGYDGTLFPTTQGGQTVLRLAGGRQVTISHGRDVCHIFLPSGTHHVATMAPGEAEKLFYEFGRSPASVFEANLLMRIGQPVTQSSTAPGL